MIPGEVRHAFVDFTTVESASIALKMFNQYQISETTLSIQYAKK